MKTHGETETQISGETWRWVRRLWARAFSSSMHYAVATVDAEGGPHVSPIGSVMLTGLGRAIYFEEFTRQLPENLSGDNRVCILAVDSGKWFWLSALARGRFPTPPAVRLRGRVVGPRRPATEDERRRWQRRVRRLRWSRGHRLLWRRMGWVREIEFDEALPVGIGPMTRHLGSSDSARGAGSHGGL